MEVASQIKKNIKICVCVDRVAFVLLSMVNSFKHPFCIHLCTVTYIFHV